jgi:predicted dienelactone hydrolase
MNKTKKKNAEYLVINTSNKVLALFVGALIFSAVVSGCSSSSKSSKADHKDRDSKTSPAEIKIDEFKLKEFAGRGYDSGTEYATETSKLSLEIGNIYNSISIVQPKRKGKYPLVIYLPGLGESSEDGKNIRNAWATSGYAVISIQPLKDDETILSTTAAKEGDFAYIRHERYSPEVVSNRLGSLNKLVELLKKRVVAGDEGIANVDLDRVAVVGFDIGANSAMILAGEDVQNIANTDFPLKVAGVIALSPYADFSGATFNSRYRKINLPVLSITSDADDDTHGVVPVTLHQAPFQYMPTGDKYLLLLAGATHAVIGNSVQTYDSPKAESNEGSKKSDNESSNKNSSRGRAGRGSKKSSSGEDTANTAAPIKRPPAGPTERAMMKVAIAHISTAFLNAHLKNDQLAREWLQKQAQPWLYIIGQLKEK